MRQIIKYFFACLFFPNYFYIGIAWMSKRILIVKTKNTYYEKSKKTTRNISLGFMSFWILDISTPTFASLKTGDPTELKFIGKSESQPIFQLDLNNSENAQYLISINDNTDTRFLKKSVESIFSEIISSPLTRTI